GRRRDGPTAAAVLGSLAQPAERLRASAAGVNRKARHLRSPGTATNRSFAMKNHVVSPQQWEAARQQLLVKEKELTRARDALAAERRRMPWQAVEKAYSFDGPNGKASLVDLFDGRRQLIVYRAFFEPGVH